MTRQIKARHVDDAIFQTSIATQPHRSPDDAKEWIEGLLGQQRFFRGDEKTSETLDVAAFEAFRSETMRQSKLIIAK